MDQLVWIKNQPHFKKGSPEPMVIRLRPVMIDHLLNSVALIMKAEESTV